MHTMKTQVCPPGATSKTYLHTDSTITVYIHENAVQNLKTLWLQPTPSWTFIECLTSDITAMPVFMSSSTSEASLYGDTNDLHCVDDEACSGAMLHCFVPIMSPLL